MAKDHRETSQYIKESGLTYTLLNNTLYDDVVPMFVGEKVLETGIYFPGGDGKVPFATRNDMAQAAAHVLATNGHENKEYSISGDVAYSFKDIAGIISEITGKDVAYISPSNDEYKEVLAAAGVPDVFVTMLAEFGLAISNTEFETNTT